MESDLISFSPTTNIHRLVDKVHSYRRRLRDINFTHRFDRSVGMEQKMFELDDLFKITPETSMQGVIERGVDASFSPLAATRQGIESVKSVFSASDKKKIYALKELMNTKQR